MSEVSIQEGFPRTRDGPSVCSLLCGGIALAVLLKLFPGEHTAMPCAVQKHSMGSTPKENDLLLRLV